MGYIIRNGIKYFGDNAVELTQAQYDALPSTKLTDGVDYYITDAQAGTPLATEIAMSTSDNTSVAEAIGNLTTYSTTERVVGTWIKGNTLYEKVVTSTITATANTQINIAHNITNLGTIVNAFINADFGGGINLPIPYLSMNAQGFYGYNSIALTGITATDIGLWFGRDRTVTVIAVLRYTKSV